jgi:hypothetical protein
MILREISLSEARKNLSAILREIEADPETGYRILVRKRAIAELRSPVPSRRKNSGIALLKLAREMEELFPMLEGKADRVTSVNYGMIPRGRRPIEPMVTIRQPC